MFQIRTLILFGGVLCIGFLVSCSTEQEEAIDCSVSGPSVVINDEGIVKANCAPNGSLTATASGGKGELMFSIDGVNFQSSPTFNELSAGQYTVTVADENECKATASAFVMNAEGDLDMSATPSATGGCGTGTGTITVDASGGSGGYTYRLGNGSFISNNVFENISGGDYNVTVKDSEGCTVSKQVKMLSGVSWSGQIKPIFDTNCNIAGCHGDDKSIPDWTIFSNIRANRSSIRSATQSKFMPQDGSLTQNQIDLIACWVDDGAPNN